MGGGGGGGGGGVEVEEGWRWRTVSKPCPSFHRITKLLPASAGTLGKRR